MRVNRALSVCAMSALCAAGALGQTRELSADASGANEVPPNASPAMGSVQGVYDFVTNSFTFSWSITDNLLGTPSLPGAHIHRAPAGSNGPIIFTFSNPDGTWPLQGQATWSNIPASDRDLLLSGGLYVNFHTSAHPSGELRGQIVPTPGALVLFGAACLAGTRRRR